MRTSFTTTIEEDLQKEFKISCIQNDCKMNEVLEEFMRQYIAGKIMINLDKK